MHNRPAIRCIVVDDEPLAVDLLSDYLHETPGMEVALKTTNVLDALHSVQQGKADLLFLDIQMPELTGIQFMKIMRNACPIILTTAYTEYALEGYEYDVVDYLLKPVTFERFMVAIEKAKRRLDQAGNASLPPAAATDHIFIKTEYRIQKIDLADVLYIEGLRDYVAIHTAAGKILSLESLRNLEELLPDHFIRIHKSYIINKNKIQFLERGKVIINKQYLPVGDTYREKFLAHIKMI